MKYKQEVSDHLETADQLIYTILRGLRDRTITADDTVNKLRQVRDLLKESQHKVSIEYDNR